MSVNILCSFSEETAAALAEHKKRTDQPTVCFIRRAVAAALSRPHASDYWKPGALERQKAESIERGEFTPGGKL